MSKDGTAPITEEESKKLIDSKMAQIIYEKINSFEKALASDIDSRAKLAVQPPKEEVAQANRTKEETFRHELSENLANLVVDNRRENKINPFVAEDYLEDGHAHIKRMIGKTVGFSGSKEELAAKMNLLRQQVKESTGSLEQKPEGNLQVKTPKLSSEETWNLIAETLTKTAENKIASAEKEIKPGKELYKAPLKEDLRSEFVEVIKQQQEEYKKNGRELDPKVVDMFIQNKSKVVDYLVPQAGAYSGRTIEGHTEISSIKENIIRFNTGITANTDNKRFSWKKTADFCASIKLNGLAEFCHEKHVDNLAKSVTGKLNKGLKDSEKINLNSRKTKSTKHDYNYGRGM